MELIDRLKIRLEISGDEENALLEELILTSEDKFLELRYPVSPYPVDDGGNVVIEKKWDSWILSAAVELYNRMGIEGQVSHNENSISRGYDSADLSVSLCAKVTPVVGIVG